MVVLTKAPYRAILGTRDEMPWLPVHLDAINSSPAARAAERMSLEKSPRRGFVRGCITCAASQQISWLALPRQEIMKDWCIYTVDESPVSATACAADAVCAICA